MLNHKSMKRISKELDRDLKNMDYSVIIYHPNKRFMEIKFQVLNKLLVFRICPDYPFKPPILFVNDDNYITHFKNMYMYYKPILSNLNTSFECPCCNTILCNWSPGYTMYLVVEEYIRNETLFTKVKTYISFRIVYKQLPFDNLLFDKIVSYL